MMASSRPCFTALRGVCQRRTTQWQQPLEQQLQALRITASSRSTSRRCFTTNQPTSESLSIEAAAEVNLDALKQFGSNSRARPVPASPSYFSRIPIFNDSYLALEKLIRTYGNLPTIPTSQVERVAWKTLRDYRQTIGEQVKAGDYGRCVGLVKRLHQIHPKLKPGPVKEALEAFKRDIQPFTNVATPVAVDKFGRAIGVGRRKSSTARAWVVEGNGEVQINGKSLADFFGRVHDRESAVWALHATNRLDKYNVWALADGGGTTGQAEALTLAIAKGLMAHEPALKPALRRAGCVTRDPRRVERKKHGRVKARKMPAWVKR
ncbi:ribosomal protein S5 domain 2-type protein [Lasiosphaeria hispida]|uniref:Small ribosomal subunit protein uS9m n=1 Tax=Lasiosphaeria hispida TaxID=260671 RepID=A0AAJ0HQV9_9PEZI|nr:ribosomal protein S5 domain 2-type protein [Lasiosphaeria hispida]